MSLIQGSLYLIPTTLGDSNPLSVLPITVKNCIEDLDIFIVENEKSARRFIKQICSHKSQATLKLFVLNKYTEESELPSFLEPCENGFNVGLLSEAGCPSVADPGSNIVMMAHEKNIKVVPLVGPSSILMAIMSSGLNGQNFAFNGYLPIEKAARKNELKRLERLSFDTNQTQLFIETPYRNNNMLEDMISYLEATTHIGVACDITLQTEFIKTQTALAWKKNKVGLHKRPTIFIIHKQA